MTTSLTSYLTPTSARQARLYKLQNRAKSGKPAPDHYHQWLQALFPFSVANGFSDHHHDFWQHIDSIEKGQRSRPFVAIWPRGGGKSTGCELACVYVGAKRKRHYIWYVRETQDQADKSIENVGALLESDAVEDHYPKLSERKIGKYGNSKGWRRNRLRSEWLTIDAVGLDGGVRGARVEEDRPDFIIFDDIDGKHDTPLTIKKKVEKITTTILPAGSNDCCVVFVQNLIHKDGVAAQLCNVADKPAEYLADRIVSGPHPAVVDLKLDSEQLDDGRIIYRVVGGTPTWEGQGLAVVEHQINTWGLTAFKQEAQHEVGDNDEALWTRDILDLTRVHKVPDNLHKIAVAIDPHATTGQTGIIVVGAANSNGSTHGYTLADATPPYGAKPDQWGYAALCAYLDNDADVIVGEINNGGDMIENTIKQIKIVYDADGIRRPMKMGDIIVRDFKEHDGKHGEPVILALDGAKVPFESVRATRGKQIRAEPVATVFTQGRGHHVGYFIDLENEQCSWVPGMESPNRLDAEVWGYTYLGLTKQQDYSVFKDLGTVDNYENPWK